MPIRSLKTRLAAGAAVAMTAGALLGPAGAAAQNPPPDADWYTFRTANFRVVYHAGLGDQARHAAEVAERTYALLADELVRPPRGTIDMVVTDHVDFSNGFATPFTSNRITVFARPPVAMPSLAYSRDWIELVVAHEVVHIFHLDRAGAVGRAVRAVLGRVPMIWPLFPALGTPIWNVEGLATYYESRLTGGGRVHGTYHDMVIRTAALESEIPRLRHVSAPSPVWPGGERSYIYGAALMDHIAGEYGPEAHAALADATYGSVLPTFLLFDHVARQALGRSFTAIYEDWRAQATGSALALRDRLARDGLTASEPVVDRGPFALAPRVAPDGTRLTYAAHDFRTDPATRVVDLATGDVRNLARRNQFGWILGPASWMPGGREVVVAQLEFQGRHRLFSDLWAVDEEGRERRLTHGQRLASPDVAPDGRRIAAARSEDGATHLIIHDLESGATRVVGRAGPGEAFHGPRWAPDGSAIAVTRYAGGRVNVVVLDPATGVATSITDDDALDSAPAWSPDGRWIVFWSDRTGIPNLFAAPAPGSPDAGPLRQVTNVVTGARDPEVAPDGRSLYFAEYHYDGWHLKRMPFDPAAWREAESPAVAYAPALLPEPTPAAPQAFEPSRPYSALPTIRPYFWGPTFQEIGDTETGQTSRFVGAFSLGWDLVQRHSWNGSVAYDVDTGRTAASGSWTWAGLGSPDIVLRGAREWSGVGRIPLAAGGAESVLLREDRMSLDAVFFRPRWRKSAAVAVGGGIRWEEYQTYRMSAAELEEATREADRPGLRLRDLPTIVNLSVRPAFSNVRMHPYSISWQDGITASLGVGRWWNLDDRRTAYDQVTGAMAGFRGFRLWGFADHVTAVRVAGLLRTGPDARTTSIGGTPGGVPDLLPGLGQAGPFLPVRGFRSGDAFGTRAWTASGEYRFPVHMRGDPSRVLGFSLTSVAGSLFADAGSAWCTEVERLRQDPPTCPRPGDVTLASVGAEIVLNVGVIHNVPLMLRSGLAVPLSGPADRPVVLHVGVGQSF
jgi:Tol biopolymer transport system component